MGRGLGPSTRFFFRLPHMICQCWLTPDAVRFVANWSESVSATRAHEPVPASATIERSMSSSCADHFAAPNGLSRFFRGTPGSRGGANCWISRVSVDGTIPTPCWNCMPGGIGTAAPANGVPPYIMPGGGGAYWPGYGWLCG